LGVHVLITYKKSFLTQVSLEFWVQRRQLFPFLLQCHELTATHCLPDTVAFKLSSNARKVATILSITHHTSVFAF
jgi:hypothetical protein